LIAEYAHKAVEPIATSSPAWNARFLPHARWWRATSAENTAPPTT
jgi:hypothetical protein